MQQQYRLKLNKQFQYVYRRGKSCACKEIVLLYARGRYTKVGFAVSKKIGNSVIRNRVKRRLRECIRPYLEKLQYGSYILIAREACGDASFLRLQNQILYLLNKQKLIRKSDVL